MNTFMYRTKLTQVEGSLKAVVSAKHLPSGVSATSRPLASELGARREVREKLLKTLEEQVRAESHAGKRNDTNVVESL